jgi:peptide/nickel transport system substrate-binding protein
MKVRILMIMAIILFCITISTGPISAKEAGTLTVATKMGTEALDPAQVFALQSIVAVSTMYDTLVTFKGATAEVIPNLAESWETSEDGKTITFHLRKGVKFHNGEELTADDVKYSFTRLLKTNLGDPAQKLNKLTAADGFIAKDRYTFVLKLKAPTPRIFSTLTSQLGFGIVCKSYVEKHATEGDPYALNHMRAHEMGSGPWKLEKWSIREKLILKRNDEYWGQKPGFDTLVLSIIPDPTTAQMMLETGDIDMALDLTMDQYSALEKTKGVTVTNFPTLRTIYMYMNCQRKPFDNIKVRKALNYAVKHDELIKYVELGKALRSYGIIAKGITGWNPDIQPKYEYNPEKAKSLLKEAGYAKGLKATLIACIQRHAPYETMLPYLISYFSDVGVEISAQKLAWSTLFAKMKKRDFDIALFSWNPYDPTTVPIHYYNSARWKKGLGWGFAFWENARFDSLLGKAIDNMNAEERYAQYKEADQLAAENAITIPLYQLKKSIAARDDIKGIEWHPTIWCKGFKSLHRGR